MDNSTERYLHTDLAAEGSKMPDSSLRGAHYEEKDLKVCSIARLHIETQEGAESIGKPIGRYVTVSFSEREARSDEADAELISAVSDEIKRLAELMCPDGISSVLVAGLGNRKITSDSLGPLCTDNLNITRHISLSEEERIIPEISAISPGVLAQTGIETVELIRGAAENCSPSLVIAIDALASRSLDRLASTVQLSDTGISPGSGRGNHRKKIDSRSI